MSSQALETALLPDDILSAILASAARRRAQGRFSFRAYDSEMQNVFGELARNEEFSLLGCFVFSDTGPRPYSPALSESFSRLQLSGFVGCENPDYEVLFLRPSAEKYFEAVLSKRLSQDDLQQVDKIAAAFLSKARVL